KDYRRKFVAITRPSLLLSFHHGVNFRLIGVIRTIPRAVPLITHSYTVVELHIRKEVNALRHIFLLDMILYRSIKQHIKHSFQVSVHTPVSADATLEFIDNIN